MHGQSSKPSPAASPSNAATEPRHDAERAEPQFAVIEDAASVEAPAVEVRPAASPVRLDFPIHVSIRYHAKRRAWLEALARWPSVVSIVAGSAAFASIAGGMPGLAALASLATVVFGALSLAFGFAQSARRHDDLFR